MEIDKWLELHPCWCGRPAVEVISRSRVADDEVETRGYCHVHCERSHVVVTRPRQKEGSRG